MASVMYERGALIAGSTEVTRYHYLQETDGTPATGKVAADLTAYYVREGQAATSVTLSDGTAAGAWGSGKVAEVDSTNCPGLVRIDWPDAAFAKGSAESVVLCVKGAGLRPSEEVVPLTLSMQLVSECTTGCTSTTLYTALSGLTAGQLNRRLLQFVGGPCAGERVLIVGQSSGGVLQVAPPLTTSPSDGDPFVIR